MRKLIVSLGLICGASGLAIATPMVESSGILPANHAFQEFDNQYYLGIGTNYGNLTNSYTENTNYGTTFIGFGIERLFDIGLWVRFDGTMMIGL